MEFSGSDGEDGSGDEVWDGITATITNSINFLSGPDAHRRNQESQRYCSTIS